LRVFVDSFIVLFLSTTTEQDTMMQAFEQAKTPQDYQRAYIEAILAVKVQEFLDDFDTVKAYCAAQDSSDEDSCTGASLKSGLADAMYGLDALGAYARAIEAGEVAH
jgi:hypothetical protein